MKKSINKRRRQKIIGISFCIIIATVVVIGFFIQQKTDFLHTVKFLPPIMTSHDCTEIEKEINKYDWDHELALAVAKAESECDSNAYGDDDIKYRDCALEYSGDSKTCAEHQRDYGYSVGAFQVRILPGREDCDGYDISKNIACAYNIYKEKGDFTPWSGFTTGKYRNYLWHTLL